MSRLVRRVLSFQLIEQVANLFVVWVRLFHRTDFHVLTHVPRVNFLKAVDVFMLVCQGVSSRRMDCFATRRVQDSFLLMA